MHSCWKKQSMEWQMLTLTMSNQWNQAASLLKSKQNSNAKISWKTTKLLGYLPVKVSPHRNLNSSKYVIKCEELDTMEEDEIKKKLQPKGIIAVKRISICYSLYVLTIKGQNILKKNQYWIPDKRNTTIHSQPSKIFSMPEIWTYQEFL